MDTGVTLTAKRSLIAIAGALAGIVCFYMLGALTLPQRIVAAVFLVVVIYWITEVFPLYLTAILGPFMLALLLDPMASAIGFEPIDFKTFIYPFASPVIVLLFGGFLMARVFSTYHLDSEFSSFFLKRLGKNPRVVLLGFMCITAFMSMWMSNTATTAIMVTTALPIIAKLPKGSRFARSLLLGIPFSANIGGIATPIGTPPNAIAIGMLADKGTHISFIQWMAAGLPAVILLIFLTWLILIIFFPTSGHDFEIEIDEYKRTGKLNRWIIYTTIIVTILFWLTDTFHGVNSYLIAMIPVIVFTITGLSGKRMLREISWEVLFLVGGGISMGVAVSKTGLADILVSALNLNDLGLLGSAFVIGGMAAVLGTIMSHTASANLLIPIAVALSSANPAFIAITTAICASYGMALPISTPPNAIAYGSELIPVKDMFKTGVIITVLGVLTSVIYGYFVIPMLIK